MIETKRMKWPTSRIRFVVFVGIFFATLIASTPSFAVEEPVPETRVVIVSMPRLTWQALVDEETPHIDSLVKRGSIASLSIRTPQNVRTIEKGYTSLATGNRALAVPSSESTFYAPDEMLEGNRAQDIFLDQQGIDAKSSAAVSLGFELVRTKNTKGLFPVEVGSFATALEDNKKSVAVFGNSDSCRKDVALCRQRAIGYLGVNESGHMKFGDVSGDLLKSDMTLNMKRVEDRAVDALEKHDVTGVECSNLERAEQARKSSTSAVNEESFTNAIQECDELIGNLVAELNLSKDRIFIVSPVSPQAQEQLTVFIAAGKDISPGYAVSGITRREGIVALADIAPSVLTFLDVEPPDSMVNTLLDFKSSSESSAQRESALIQTNDRALIRDSSFAMVSAIFIATVFLGAILSIIAYTKFPRLRESAKILSLISACMPTVTFLMLPLMLTLGTSVRIAIAFLIFSMIGATVAYVLGEKYGYVRVLLGIVSINLLVQILDIITGGNLQLNSLFGYSAIVAGRFAGFGNLTFSIVAISAVCFVGLVQELAASRPSWNMRWVNAALMAFLVGVLIVDGAPTLGSDVGGVLALTPTIYIIFLMLYNKRMNIKSFVIAAVSAILAISIFSLFDLTRPISERTHLGRFVKVFLDGEAGVVIERKIFSNFHILTNSLVASVVILGTLYGIFLFMRPEKFLAKSREAHPSFRYIAYPGLVVGILGMFLNDSGVAIPGMMIAIAFPVLSLLTFESSASESDTTLEDQSV